MIEGRLAGGRISNKLPFNLIISTVRRQKLMSTNLLFEHKSKPLLGSIMSKDPKEKADGSKVLQVRV